LVTYSWQTATDFDRKTAQQVAIAAMLLANSTHFWLSWVAGSSTFSRGGHWDPAKNQGVVRAIEGISEIDPTGPIERFMVRLLLYSYKQRLRAIVAAVPTEKSEGILRES
jgi:hypothetical protein